MRIVISFALLVSFIPQICFAQSCFAKNENLPSVHELVSKSKNGAELLKLVQRELKNPDADRIRELKIEIEKRAAPLREKDKNFDKRISQLTQFFIPIVATAGGCLIAYTLTENSNYGLAWLIIALSYLGAVLSQASYDFVSNDIEMGALNSCQFLLESHDLCNRTTAKCEAVTL